MEEDKDIKEKEGVLPESSEYAIGKGNDFTGIDMLISTPESMNDLRLRLDAARKNEADMMAKVNEAHEEVCKLERLIRYFESKPVTGDSGIVNGNPLTGDTAASQSSFANKQNNTNEDGRTLGGCVVSTEDVSDNDDRGENYYKRRRLTFWALVVVGGAFLAAIGIFIYRYVSGAPMENIEVVYADDFASKDSLRVEDKVATDSLNSGARLNQRKDEVAKPVENKSGKVDQGKTEGRDENATASKIAVKRDIPSTHTIQKGETLFGISKRYYGTIDSVDAIVRVNGLKNRNNISYGKKVKLP